MKKRMILIASVVVLIVVAIFLTTKWTAVNQRQTAGAVVEKINDLNELMTAEAYTKVIIERENNEIFGKEIDLNIPGTKQKLLVIIPGTVRAGIDLSNVTSSDVKIDEENHIIELFLPNPSIQGDPVIDLSKVKVFSSEGLFRDEATIKEGFKLEQEAQKEMMKEATEQGLLERAKINAEQSMADLFSLVDYKVVTKFKE